MSLRRDHLLCDTYSCMSRSGNEADQRELWLLWTRPDTSVMSPGHSEQYIMTLDAAKICLLRKIRKFPIFGTEIIPAVSSDIFGSRKRLLVWHEIRKVILTRESKWNLQLRMTSYFCQTSNFIKLIFIGEWLCIAKELTRKFSSTVLSAEQFFGFFLVKKNVPFLREKK